MRTCAFCTTKYCRSGDFSNLPQNCPCREEETLKDVETLYQDEENHKLAYNSALVEANGYCVMARLEETIEFAHRCEYTNLGVAFCAGLSGEAKLLCTILRDNGFEVSSIACKNGGIPKEHLGIKDEDKVRKGGFEPMCNPIGQAMFLNEDKVDLNILLGLCVGHDSLFIKYAQAPVTVFAAKDRVLVHNPVAALYCADSYFKKRFYK